MTEQTFPRMHMGYHVSNLQNTIDFYTKFFGVEPVKVKKDYVKFILTQPSLNISFIENPDHVQKDHLHFGIEVNNAKDLQHRLGQALRYDLSIDDEKEVKCCYAKQDKFWVTDPDGYRWEVFHFKEDVTSNDEQYSTEGACCTT